MLGTTISTHIYRVCNYKGMQTYRMKIIRKLGLCIIAVATFSSVFSFYSTIINNNNTRNWRRFGYADTVEQLIYIPEAANITGIRLNDTSNTLQESPKLFSIFRSNVQKLCGDKIMVYARTLFVFKNVTVVPQMAKIRGVENKTLNEQSEFYKLKLGFFSIYCEKPVPKLSPQDDHLKEWENGLLTHNLDTQLTSRTPVRPVADLCVVITRIEYANLYWTLIDLYDIYLTSMFTNTVTERIHILMLDAHPSGHLDSFWKMFASVQRPKQMKESLLYNNLVWLFPRKESPILSKTLTPLPYVAQFRRFVLKSHDLSPDHKRECDRLNILLILRRNYVAHPRNPSGKISRKIRNEEELIQALKSKFPQFNVTGTQMDLLSIKKQLELISKTDIYIGMHGAGLAYSIFMPEKSALIELFPAYYKSRNWHMKHIAEQSGHFYIEWRNNDFSLENKKDMYTVVPPNIVVNLIEKSIKNLC